MSSSKNGNYNAWQQRPNHKNSQHQKKDIHHKNITHANQAKFFANMSKEDTLNINNPEIQIQLTLFTASVFK